MNDGIYSALGGFFEYLNSDCGYLQWSQYLIKKLKQTGAPRDGVDMGCGNGYFTRALYKAGYDVKGMDVSPQMLSKAVGLARKEGVGAEFLMGDITKLKLSPKTGFVTAINDCINYVPQNKLVKTFKCVYGSLRRGGVFIFDVSSEYKLKNLVGNNTFVKDFEKATVVWSNYLKDDRVETEITLFALNKDGSYARSDEKQTQYIHSESSVLAALEQAGFTAESESLPGKDKTERINFLCKKP